MNWSLVFAQAIFEVSLAFLLTAWGVEFWTRVIICSFVGTFLWLIWRR